MKRKSKNKFNGIGRSIKTYAPWSTICAQKGWASASITSWKLSNKLLMDILTIYYRYSIRRLTWDIKNLKQNIFFTFQPYLAIQWSSIHEIIRRPTRIVDKKNDVAYANYFIYTQLSLIFWDTLKFFHFPALEVC